MAERSVTFQGKPLTLTGNEIKVGDKAPDVELVDVDLKGVKISSFKGKTLLVLTVPSLDTSVCSTETKRINKEIAALGDNVVTVTISRDLPFAQKRWCGAEQVTNLKTLSDYKEGAFGQKYGVLVKELQLLARAVFIIDREGVVRYFHLVNEITQEPPYADIIKEVKGQLASAK